MYGAKLKEHSTANHHQHNTECEVLKQNKAKSVSQSGRCHETLVTLESKPEAKRPEKSWLYIVHCTTGYILRKRNSLILLGINTNSNPTNVSTICILAEQLSANGLATHNTAPHLRVITEFTIRV